MCSFGGSCFDGVCTWQGGLYPSSDFRATPLRWMTLTRKLVLLIIIRACTQVGLILVIGDRILWDDPPYFICSDILRNSGLC